MWKLRKQFLALCLCWKLHGWESVFTWFPYRLHTILGCLPSVSREGWSDGVSQLWRPLLWGWKFSRGEGGQSQCPGVSALFASCKSLGKTETTHALWHSGSIKATDNQKFLSTPQAVGVIQHSSAQVTSLQGLQVLPLNLHSGTVLTESSPFDRGSMGWIPGLALAGNISYHLGWTERNIKPHFHYRWCP